MQKLIKCIICILGACLGLYLGMLLATAPCSGNVGGVYCNVHGGWVIWSILILAIIGAFSGGKLFLYIYSKTLIGCK